MENKARLAVMYKEEVVPALMKQFGYKNINEVPKLNKITLNMGLGDVKDNSKSFNIALEELEVIAGQKPVATRAKKAISNFKVREGMKVGATVTLRGNKMYEFLDRLISIALPRVRDFRGISPKSFDGRGNYSMGIKEQLIFPEISYDKIDKIRGFDINIITTAKTDAEALELLRALGMPFRN
ncbi:MAG TPA: 50S ribosomal protein L5 [Candidatus Caccopulliclostridium gallistercoris]|uniref:Large ribosomal subunit protein uL5 n=1 Tax=Candidatus Caccopulliclostridium gallistercoris TaxID=2840719 RepID=A0A9D1NDC9_9FIRM|nr:50S ribosomal protein L5 [Candidatus Caccopulliclostridium gallistercoris]